MTDGPVDPAAAARTRSTRAPLRLQAADGPVAIDLTIEPAKPAALHGDRGYSVKGEAAGNASFYYSWSRLKATGVLTTADGGEYPNDWNLRVPGSEVDLTVTPLLADQELSVSFRYWEGAVRVEGTVEGRAVSGYGYVEMTRYAPIEGGGAGPGL